MTPLSRDDLAEVLKASRDEATALGDLRVGLADLNGNMQSLTTEVRLGIVHLSGEQTRLAAEHAITEQRVERVEKWQWRIAGISGGIGAIAGGLGAAIFRALGVDI